MIKIMLSKPSTPGWLTAWLGLTFCVPLTVVAADPYLVLVSERTTLTIQLKIPGSSDPVFRRSTYTDPKSLKLESALVGQLDFDEDGHLSVSEQSKAESLLRRLDYDEDECLVPLELASDLLTARGQATASPKIVAVLIRSSDDARAIESLRREFDRLSTFSLDSVDATIKSASLEKGGVVVHAEDNSTVQVNRLDRPSGTARFLLIKDDVTVELSVQQPWIESSDINLRPGRQGLFEWLDTDGDSKLSRVELIAAGKSDLHEMVLTSARPFENSISIWLGNAKRRRASIALLPAGGGTNRQQTETPDWFGAIDRNRDGVVSVNEFLSGDQKFRDLDADDDGLLTREEVVFK